MKLEQTSFINGTRNLLYPKIPFFLSSRAYRDPTVPITQYNGLCHVTLYHTYPLGVNHQVARTFQETRNWGLPSHINPPLARQNQKKRRPRLHTLLARVFTPCSLASSHLARPRLDTLLARIFTPCSPASSHLARPSLQGTLTPSFPRRRPALASARCTRAMERRRMARFGQFTLRHDTDRTKWIQTMTKMTACSVAPRR